MCALVGVTKTINVQILYQVTILGINNQQLFECNACSAIYLLFFGSKQCFSFYLKILCKHFVKIIRLCRKCISAAIFVVFLAIYWKTICNNFTDYMHGMYVCTTREWGMCTTHPYNACYDVCDYMLCLHKLFWFSYHKNFCYIFMNLWIVLLLMNSSQAFVIVFCELQLARANLICVHSFSIMLSFNNFSSLCLQTNLFFFFWNLS